MKSFIPVSMMLSTTVYSNPVFVNLKSQYPANPIEDPQTWAWGVHPDNGLDYKARDNLEVDVCLANPSMINTAKCKLPLDVCLENPQYLSSLGCSGNDLPPLSLDICLTYPELLTYQACSGHKLSIDVCLANPQLLTKPSCAGNKYSLETCLQYPEILSGPGCADNLTPSMCASTPMITMIPLCLDALDGYQPTLFECQDNKKQLCSLNLCAKHEFIVKCNG